MPVLSTEFVVGAVLTIIALAIGLAVTLAMDAKTKGEFRVAVGCFLLPASIIIYGIVRWQVSTDLTVRSRVIVAFGLIALVCVLTGEAIRWAHSRHVRVGEKPSSLLGGHSAPSGGAVSPPRITEPAKKPTPPILKTLRFTTIIPFSDTSQNVPIPLNTNNEDPKVDFFRDLLGLANRPDQPPEGVTYKERKLETPNDKFIFVTRLMQYYVLHSLRVLQGGRQGTRWTAGKGVTAIDVMPIIAPDATPYSTGTLIHELEDNEFFNQFDRVLWTARPFKLPRGSLLSLREKQPTNGPFECSVRLERAQYYRIDFILSPGISIQGQPPAGFQTMVPVSSYPVTITMDYEVQLHGDSFDSQTYTQWADDLFFGLKNIMAP